VGLSIPYLSRAGMRSVFEQLLELGPMRKCLYSSDAHFIPEWFYLSEKWAKITVQNTLQKMRSEGEISERFAIDAYIGIFNRNASELYAIGRSSSKTVY